MVKQGSKDLTSNILELINYHLLALGLIGVYKKTSPCPEARCTRLGAGFCAPRVTWNVKLVVLNCKEIHCEEEDLIWVGNMCNEKQSKEIREWELGLMRRLNSD